MLERLLPLVVVLVVACGGATAARAQVATDPNGAVYADLEVWQARGLTGPLPALQPYPLQFLEHLLERVAGHPLASAADRRDAGRWLRRLRTPWHVTAEVQTRATTADDGPYGLLAVDPDLQASPLSWLTFSGRARVMALRLADGLALPALRGNPEDLIAENTEVDVAGQPVSIRQVSYGSLGVGAADGRGLAHVAFARHRIGPFFRNGLVAGGQAPQAGELSAMMHDKLYTAHVALYELTAASTDGTRLRSGKHFFYHSLELHPVGWFDVGAFETVTTGRLDVRYAIPVASFFHTQGTSGYDDNILVGGTARARPAPGLEARSMLYVDDMGFAEIARGQLDAMYKFALQAGVVLSPSTLFGSPGSGEHQWFRLFSIDYTAIMPYVFTHQSTTDPEFRFEDGSHGGVGFGSVLAPNSDRVEALAVLRPWDRPTTLVDVELRGTWVRHGNASAGIIPGADGSLADPGYLDGVPTFTAGFDDPTGQPRTRFLTQRVLESTLQLSAGLRASWEDDPAASTTAPFTGRWTLGLDATWQWQRNPGFVDGAVASALFVGTSLAWRY